MPDLFMSMADFESWFDFSGVGEAGADEHILAQEQRNRVVRASYSSPGDLAFCTCMRGVARVRLPGFCEAPPKMTKHHFKCDCKEKRLIKEFCHRYLNLIGPGGLAEYGGHDHACVR